jgi:hypothetical protein
MRYFWILLGGIVLAGGVMAMLVPVQSGHVPAWEI